MNLDPAIAYARRQRLALQQVDAIRELITAPRLAAGEPTWTWCHDMSLAAHLLQAVIALLGGVSIDSLPPKLTAPDAQ